MGYNKESCGQEASIAPSMLIRSNPFKEKLATLPTVVVWIFPDNGAFLEKEDSI